MTIAPKETVYVVTVSHPTGFHAGDHNIRVRMNSGGESRFCGGSVFGCSRDYTKFTAKTDKDAIAVFLREHGCTVVKVVKSKG